MGDRAYAQAQAQQKTSSGSVPKSSLLQRTCACGQHTIAGGECDECRKNREDTLHRSQRAFGPPSAPVAGPGSSPAEVNGAAFNAAFDRASRFGHDFSRIPVDAPAQEHGTAFNAAFDRASRFGHDFSQIPIHPRQTSVPQTKLTVNQPGDVYEQEADQVAAQVMRMPEPQLQRACACGGACPKCQTEQPGREHERLQTQRVGSGDWGQTAVPAIVDEVLRSPGQPLDAATRAFMEPRFGHDFSRVRVHADARAAESAQSLNALAYTVGRHIVFGEGQHSANLAAGQQLLAHELTHVIQQSPSTNFRNSLTVEPTSIASESDASAIMSDKSISAPHKPRTAPTISHAIVGGIARAPDRDTGYIMPNDRIKLEFLLRGNLKEKYTQEYYVSEAGVHLQQLQEPVQIAKMMPKDAADKIAKAYIDNEIFREPVVQLTVWKSGQGNTKKIVVLSTYHSQAGTPESKPQGKLHNFLVYWDKIRGTPEFTLRAQDFYYHEVEQNLDKWETPEKLWEWAREEASKPLGESPLQGFYNVFQAKKKHIASLPLKDRELYQDALDRYYAWLKAHQDDPHIGKYDPEDIWGKAFRDAFPAEGKRVEAENLRKFKESHKPKVDKEALNKKLDKVDDFLKDKGICQAKDPEHIEGKSEGVDYLIWTADAQTRKKICYDFQRELFSHTGDPDFTRTSLEDDYNDYFYRHPEQKQALSQERVERSEMEGETIATWRTVLEVVFSLLPYVGQIMGGYEAISGTEFWTNRHLSNTERAILAASDLLPAATKIYKEAKATVTVNTLRGTYSFLSDAEARGLLRATAPIKPGSEAARLLEKAASDINAGQRIKTTEIKELDKLFQEMGLTDEAMARAISKRSGSLLGGVEKQAEEIAAKEIKSLGAMSGETVEMLKLEENAVLRHELAENSLAAEVLKHCSDLCFPRNATTEQIRTLEQHLEQVKVTGKYNENMLREFLYNNRDNLDKAIGDVMKNKTARHLDSFLTEEIHLKRGFKITLVPAKEDPRIRGALVERSHDIGVMHGRAYAGEKLGLKGTGFVNPFERVGKYGQGFDDIMVLGSDLETGIIYIVEYKGGSAVLAEGQMELEWVVGNIRRLFIEGGQDGQMLASKLARALREGRLRGVALSTALEGNIAKETQELKDWVYDVKKLGSKLGF